MRQGLPDLLVPASARRTKRAALIGRLQQLWVGGQGCRRVEVAGGQVQTGSGCRFILDSVISEFTIKL